MNPENNDKILCEKYPKIFCDRHGNPSTTAMCWGISCDDGWFNILDTLCRTIQGHIDWTHKRHELDAEWNADPANELRISVEPIEQVVAVQVKEKFGGLRFYYRGGDENIAGMVRLAEEYSYRVCEVTGDAGILHINHGLMKTLSPRLVASDQRYADFIPYTEWRARSK